MYSRGNKRFVYIAAGEAKPFDKEFPIQPECISASRKVTLTLTLTLTDTRVEVGSNTSTVTLQVVGGDE
jgi:hypothetical protein